MSIVNYRSGNLNISITYIDKDGVTQIYNFKTAQTFDPQEDGRTEVIHTLSQHRSGYLDKPSNISITLGLIATKDDGVSVDTLDDVKILKYLSGKFLNPDNSISGFFKLTLTDAINMGSGTSFVFYSCIVQSANPANVVIDGVPVSTWNILSLDSEYIGDKTIKYGDNYLGRRIL